MVGAFSVHFVSRVVDCCSIIEPRLVLKKFRSAQRKPFVPLFEMR